MTPFFRAFLTGTVNPEPPGKGSFSYPNPGPYRAPIGLRRGSSGEFRAKRGYFRARFSGATFYRGFEAIRALSAGISVLYYCLLIGESGYGMGRSMANEKKGCFGGHAGEGSDRRKYGLWREVYGCLVNEYIFYSIEYIMYSCWKRSSRQRPG
jgi:hypothetical protein